MNGYEWNSKNTYLHHSISSMFIVEQMETNPNEPQFGFHLFLKQMHPLMYNKLTFL